MEADRLFEDPPISGSWHTDDILRLLTWAADNGASDIKLTARTEPWARLDGVWRIVSESRLAADNIEGFLIDRKGQAFPEIVRSGQDQDIDYDIKVDRGTFVRYRLNATMTRKGISVIMRTIPNEPPQLELLDVEQEILDKLFPGNGLVLVTGVMGSGKTTLLSAAMRWMRENTTRHIQTFEHPIEFDLTNIRGAKGPITQVDVPNNLLSFARAPRNAARRAVDVALIGESRDAETLRGMIEGAEMGVAAYSTVHTRSVGETIARIINVFPANEQPQIQAALVASTRLIVQQRLVPALDGGRVAVRSWLAVDSELREELYTTPIKDLTKTLHDLVFMHGRTLTESALILNKQGKIDESYLEAIHQEELTDERWHELKMRRAE